MAWYNYGVTQSFNPPRERGVDLGVPFHTPITTLFGGTVINTVCSAPYQGPGCEVGIKGPMPFIEGVEHLDILAVHPGQKLAPGAVLGWSGGQLSGGSHPANRRFSSGPHIEYNEWTGNYASRWQGSGSINPIGTINAARAGKLGSLGASVAAPGSSQASVAGAPGLLGATAGIGFPTIDFTPLIDGAKNALKRVGVYAIAFLFVILGIVIVFAKPAYQAAEKFSPALRSTRQFVGQI